MKSSTGSEASKARQTRATEAGGRAATERKALSLPGMEWRGGNGPGAVPAVVRSHAKRSGAVGAGTSSGTGTEISTNLPAMVRLSSRIKSSNNQAQGTAHHPACFICFNNSIVTPAFTPRAWHHCLNHSLSFSLLTAAAIREPKPGA